MSKLYNSSIIYSSDYKPFNSAIYAVELGRELGIAPQSITRYSGDKNHLFDKALEFKTGTPEAADKMSAAVAGARNAMGASSKDIPIEYDAKHASFSLSTKDIEKYETAHGGQGTFIRDFHLATAKTDASTGKKYKQEIDEARKMIKAESNDHHTQVASQHLPQAKKDKGLGIA